MIINFYKITHNLTKNTALIIILMLFCVVAKAQYSTIEMMQYFGGTSLENIYGGNTQIVGDYTYVVGFTQSANLPVTNGSTYKGNTDLYLAKFDMAGNLLFCSYYGGSGQDGISDQRPTSIAVDGENVIFVGYTKSPDIPVTNSSALSDQTVPNWDNFIVNVNTFTGQTVMSTYLGGTESYDYGSPGTNNPPNHSRLRYDNGNIEPSLKST